LYWQRKDRTSRETDRAGKAEDRKVWVIVSHDTKDISKLKANETLVLDNIYFLPGSHHVTETSKPELDKLLRSIEIAPKTGYQYRGAYFAAKPKSRSASSSQQHPQAVHFLDGFRFRHQNGSSFHKTGQKKYTNIFIQKGIDKSRLNFQWLRRNQENCTR